MKVLWVDTETTGVDPRQHCLIQIGYLIEIDGEVAEEGEVLSAPLPNAKVEQAALDVHGRSLEEINSYPSARNAYLDFTAVLGKYVDKFNRQDKFIPAGYFVGFDTGMLRSWFGGNGDKYYGSWMHSVSIDVASWVALKVAAGEILPNNKLSTWCDRFEIEIEAHDALSDIRATRELFRCLRCANM